MASLLLPERGNTDVKGSTMWLGQQLQNCVKRGRVLTAEAQLAGYDADALGYKTFRPDAVVIPADADELIEVLRYSRTLNVPLCIRGAGTSLSGGPVAAQGGVVVHTSQLRKVRHICKEGLWCELECSVTLNQLDAALAPHGVFYPPDPSSGPVCTIGGNVAMNAGGARCFRYGVTSNYVLGVEAVLLDGSVHRFGGPAGGRGAWREDWKRFMVGSDVTLAAFTRFWLRLTPRPEKAWTFRATYADLVSAERAIHALVADSSCPVAIELMDPRCVAMVENSPMAVGLPRDSFMLLTEIDGPVDLVDSRVDSVADIMRQAGAQDVQYSDQDEPRAKLWKARKVAGGLMGQLSADYVVQDAVIPKRALAEMLQFVYDEADAAGLASVNVFHAGDGNLHPNFLFDSRKEGEFEKVEAIGKRLMQRVVDVGGTLSGEHGIGNDKSSYMPLVFGLDAMRMQLAVPGIFNARHQLNPLKVFETRRFGGSEAARVERGVEVVAGERDARCFDHFLDEIDGVVCLSAEATAAEIEALGQPHRLRFPLLLDQNATLLEQVAATTFAPASSLFGPFCDNILGMNWQLPDGRVVRLGERVVKTTTGYDLFRFFLGSGDRYGRPIDYVLRLRPICDVNGVFRLTGSAAAVSTAVPSLLASCWIHWFDSIDYLISDASSDSRELRIVVNAQSHEWSQFESFIHAFGTTNGLVVAAEHGRPAPLDGCPDVVFKTSPEKLITIAEDVARSGTRVVAQCGCGVVHGYVADNANPVAHVGNLVREFADWLCAD